MARQSWLRLPEYFDRDLKLLLCSMSVRRISMGFLGVVRAIYFAMLGFSPIEIGLLLSLATFVSAIHHITFGMLSDRFGRKPFLILGGIFSTLRIIIFAVSSDFWMLALGQGLGAMGEGVGAGQPVVSGYIADKINMEKRSSIFTVLAVSNGLAATVGSLMAGLPAFFQSTLAMNMIEAHSLLFWIGTVGGVASIMFTLPLKEVKPVKSIKVEKQKSLKPKSWGIIARFSLVRSTSGVGFGFINSLLSLYFYTQFGVGGEVLGPMFALARFISVFSYIFVPMVVKRFGDVRSLVASRIISAILTLFFAIATSFPLAIGLMVAFRIVLLFSMPIRQSFATGIVDPDEIATAIGVSNSVRMGLRTVAPTIAGYMFENISLTLPFFSGASLLIVNGVLFRTFFGTKKSSST